MGYKKKWIDDNERRLSDLLDNLRETTHSLFSLDGEVNLDHLQQKSDLEYLLALILNCKFISSEDKYFRSFGADDVIAIQLEIENNRLLKYWGEIHWLSTPKDHDCYQSYQDPFFGVFELENGSIKMVQAMFGDYDKYDLDTLLWRKSEINWMYDINS